MNGSGGKVVESGGVICNAGNRVMDLSGRRVMPAKSANATKTWHTIFRIRKTLRIISQGLRMKVYSFTK